MNVQDLIDATNGQFVSVTGPDDKQCTAIPHKWETMLGLPIVFGNAKDTFNNAPDDTYEKELNTPENFPRPGSIIVWNDVWGEGYGHTGVIVSANVNTFDVLEQNDGDGGLTHVGTHDYANIIGWFFPRVLDVAVAPLAAVVEPVPAPAPVEVPVSETSVPDVLASSLIAQQVGTQILPTSTAPLNLAQPVLASVSPAISTPNLTDLTSEPIIINEVKHMNKYNLHNVLAVATYVVTIAAAVLGYFDSTQTVSLLGLVTLVAGVIEHTKITNQ